MNNRGLFAAIAAAWGLGARIQAQPQAKAATTPPPADQAEIRKIARYRSFLRKTSWGISGPGIRQGERIARQVARANRDPFEASNKCIERIKARRK